MDFSKPDFVFFDLGNVLLNFDHDIACTNLAGICQRDPNEIRKVVFESELQQQYEDGRIDTSDFHKAFCAELKVDVARDELCRAASDIFTPNYSMIPLVSQLKLGGVKMGILSNTCEAHWEFVFDDKYCFLNQYFQVYALSFELRSSKPDNAIYERAIGLTDVSPQQIFFTDDRAENVEAAKAAGMDAVQFHSSLQLSKELMDRRLLPGI